MQLAGIEQGESLQCTIPQHRGEEEEDDALTRQYSGRTFSMGRWKPMMEVVAPLRSNTASTSSAVPRLRSATSPSAEAEFFCVHSRLSGLHSSPRWSHGHALEYSPRRVAKSEPAVTMLCTRPKNLSAISRSLSMEVWPGSMPSLGVRGGSSWRISTDRKLMRSLYRVTSAMGSSKYLCKDSVGNSESTKNFYEWMCYDENGIH